MTDTEFDMPSQARKNLADAIAKSGIHMRELSRLVGKNESYIEQYIKRGSPRVLPDLIRQILAERLKIDELLIAGHPLRPSVQAYYATSNMGAEEKVRSYVGKGEQPAVADVDLGQLFPTEMRAGLLPNFGTVQGGDGGMLISGIPESWVDRPGQLRGRNNAFALRVSGNSMSPKYQPGATVFVNPSKPPIKGCYLVVAVEDDCGTFGYIKQYVGQSKDEIILSQLNPQLEIRFPLHKVVTYGVVIGSLEAF